MRRPARPAPRRCCCRPPGCALAFAAWWVITSAFSVPAVILPRPGQVWAAYGKLPGYLLTQAGVTLWETVAGFALAVAAGAVAGLLIATSAVLERACYPLLVAVNAVPKVAVAPMLVAWLGFGARPVLALVFLLCFFPIVLSTASGLMSTPADLVELSRSLSASRRQTFTKVRIPAAMPQVFVGLKVAMPLASVGAVIGEFQSGVDAGLGFVILTSSGLGDSPTTVAAVGLVAAMSVPLFYAVAAVERLVVPWVAATTSRR